MKNKCDKCNKESVWKDQTNQELCKDHFLQQIEKRIRKNLRINNSINLKEEHNIEKHKEKKHLLTEYFLKRIFKDRIKLNKQGKIKAKKISSNTLDDEAESLLKYFTDNQKIEQEKIKPLSVITDEEAKKVSEITNINIILNKKKIHEITDEEPQILFSMNKSKNFIEERIKK